MGGRSFGTVRYLFGQECLRSTERDLKLILIWCAQKARSEFYALVLKRAEDELWAQTSNTPIDPTKYWDFATSIHTPRLCLYCWSPVVQSIKDSDVQIATMFNHMLTSRNRGFDQKDRLCIWLEHRSQGSTNNQRMQPFILTNVISSIEPSTQQLYNHERLSRTIPLTTCKTEW